VNYILIPQLHRDIPLYNFVSVFQQQICADISICKLCFEWSNLILNRTTASGCLQATATFGSTKIPTSLGCFENTNIVPTCFGQCDGFCNFNGNCKDKKCICSSDWRGSDCSLANKCLNNCSKRGNCIEGTCQCDSNYYGADCSIFSTVNPLQSSVNHGIPTNGIVIGALITITVIVIALSAVIWYFYSKKKSENYRRLANNLRLEDDNEDDDVTKDKKAIGLEDDFDQKLQK